MVDKFSKHVHLKSKKLYGWCLYCAADERHAALAKSIRKDGYATTIRRLNFLHNIANRQDNEKLREVAARDENWVRRHWMDGNWT